tara:strand:+ start:375 stop:974 length:600 start_codon:yes stop_codon:yes gene_type:complete
MARYRSIRITGNTNIVKILNQFGDANRGSHKNPSVLKGVMILGTNPGTNISAIVSVYDNNIGSGFTVPAAVALAATANTITLSSGTWEDKGLYIGQKIATSGADESDNDIASMTITNLTSTVITVDEDLTTDSSDAGLVIDSAAGDNEGLVMKFLYNYASDGSAEDLQLFYNGLDIMCSEGLRFESNSWTNLEVYAIVG